MPSNNSLRRYATATYKGGAYFVWVVLVFGCGGQGGRYVTTESESSTFSSRVGCLDIVKGYDAQNAHETGTVDEQNLIYFAITTPGAHAYSSAGSSGFDEYVTSLNKNWETDAGTFAVSISWNRLNDTIAIGGKEFQRRIGNVFVVKIGTNSLSCTQLAGPGPHASFEDALQSIQRQITNDLVIDTLELNK